MEIKRCPFCGANATTSVCGEDNTLIFKITCSKCGVFKRKILTVTYAGSFDDVLKAIDSVAKEWNERK